jgi:hypothetical protein
MRCASFKVTMMMAATPIVVNLPDHPWLSARRLLATAFLTLLV